MIHCQNCGQASTSESNFCRFCGARIALRERTSQTPFAGAAPRPYMWKTDEFQIADAPARRPPQINQVQPLSNFRQPPMPAAPPFAYPPPPPPVAPYAAHCPRCGNQGFPRFVKKISPAGWIVFAALLVVFFPLFWIGLLIKEDVKVCGFCNLRLG